MLWASNTDSGIEDIPEVTNGAHRRRGKLSVGTIKEGDRILATQKIAGIFRRAQHSSHGAFGAKHCAWVNFTSCNGGGDGRARACIHISRGITLGALKGLWLGGFHTTGDADGHAVGDSGGRVGLKPEQGAASSTGVDVGDC